MDHEDTTRKMLMNSSLRQLLECLLEHADFIAFVRSTFGSNAYIESDYPPYILENHAKRLAEIDAAAVDEYAFWGEMIEVERGEA